MYFEPLAHSKTILLLPDLLKKSKLYFELILILKIYSRKFKDPNLISNLEMQHFREKAFY